MSYNYQLNNDDIKRSFLNLDRKEDYIKELEKKPIKIAKEMLANLDEYVNQNVRKIVYFLSKEIPVYRGVRGDGNCFYRAFAFQFLELSLVKNKKESLDTIYFFIKDISENSRKFENFCDKNSIYQHTKRLYIPLIPKQLLLYIDILYKFSKEKSKEIISFKLMSLFNKIEEFDFGIIVIFRMIAWESTRYFLKNNKIEPILTENLQTLEVLLQDIKVYGCEAEQLVISSLSKFLKLRVTVNYIDKNNIDGKPIYDIHESSLGNYFNINLFFRPGHYDIGYDNEAANEIYRDVLTKNNWYDLKKYFDKLDLAIFSKLSQVNNLTFFNYFKFFNFLA